MPRSLRYGLAIAAVMGLLFLMAYVFRHQLTDAFKSMGSGIVYGASPLDESIDNGENPFANLAVSEDGTDIESGETYY